MDKKWILREEYYVKNAHEFLTRDEWMRGLALKATPSVEIYITGKKKNDEIIDELINKHESDLDLMRRCLNLGYDEEHIFHLIEYNEKNDVYHVRIWELIEIEPEEYISLRILRENKSSF